MNELQLGLIGLGGAAVAAVVAYNKWQEHRHRKLAEQVLQRDHADVLLGRERGRSDDPVDEAVDYEAPPVFAEPLPETTAEMISEAPVRARPAAGERLEPVLHASDETYPVVDETDFAAAGIATETDDPELPALPSAETLEATELSAAPAVETPPRAAAIAAESFPDNIASPMIDYVASFELVEPVSGHQILNSQRELLARVSKPVSWAGCNDRSGQWERVGEGGSYRRLRVGLLLADRRGPLGEADLLTFYGAMQNLADELMAVADMPPRETALDAAVALDQFCANVDIQVGINVIGKGQPFVGTKIRALAEAAGMVLDPSGRFVRCDDDGHVQYTMANQESAGFSAETMKTMTTHGLVFILDVPCVGHGDRVFAQMLDLARRMADALGGVLVDDNRRPLTESMLDPFRRQIGQYQAQLAAKGLPAGSPLTLRLFS